MNALFETGGDGATATTHDWLTPPEILHALGSFDLDPCASQFQPWRTAEKQLTILDNGLNHEWSGRVWCNPPYGAIAVKFLERCVAHGNAIALCFARTDTVMFHEQVFEKASALLFMRGRVSFRLPSGGKAGTSGAPSVLIAYGENNATVLAKSGIAGAFLRLN